MFNLFWTILLDKNQIPNAVSTISQNTILSVDETLLESSTHLSDVYEGKYNKDIRARLGIHNAKLSDLDIKFTVAFLLYDEMKAIMGKEILSSYVNYSSISQFRWLGQQLSALSLFETQEPSNRYQMPLLQFENMHQALLTFEENICSEILSPKSSPKQNQVDLVQNELDEVDEGLYRQARL